MSRETKPFTTKNTKKHKVFFLIVIASVGEAIQKFTTENAKVTEKGTEKKIDSAPLRLKTYFLDPSLRWNDKK